MTVNRHIFIVCLILMTGFSKTLYANQPGESYAGVQNAMLNYSETGFPDLEPTVLMLRYGYFVYSHVAVEGRLGIGTADDSATAGSYRFNLDISAVYGAYLAGHYPHSNKLNLYGLAGISMIDLTHTSTSATTTNTVSDTDASYSFAIGGDYAVSKNLGFNVEYARYYSVDEIIIDAIGLGFSFKF